MHKQHPFPLHRRGLGSAASCPPQQNFLVSRGLFCAGISCPGGTTQQAQGCQEPVPCAQPPWKPASTELPGGQRVRVPQGISLAPGRPQGRNPKSFSNLPPQLGNIQTNKAAGFRLAWAVDCMHVDPLHGQLAVFVINPRILFIAPWRKGLPLPLRVP